MATKTSGAPPGKRRKYDGAFQAEALRLASESRRTPAVARQLGIGPKLLYRWQQAPIVAEGGSMEVARDPEGRQLRVQLKRSEQALDSLTKPGLLRPAGPVSAYQHIAQRAAHVPVRPLCHVLRVAPSAPMPGTGTRASPCPSQRGKKPCARRLTAVALRSFVPRTTGSGPAVRAAPNRPLGQPAPTAPHQVRAGDITELPRPGGGWRYLAGWRDRCSRKVVGRDVRSRDARRPGQRSRAPAPNRARRPLRPGPSVHVYAIQ